MTATVAALVARDVVRASGGDAATFLQGQISQDVEAVGAGGSAWSLVMAPQGKVEAWCRLARCEDGSLLLDVGAGFGPGLVARLERFKLRVDATFELLEGWQMLSVRGSFGNPDGLDAVQAEFRAPVAWPGFEGVDLLGPAPAPYARFRNYFRWQIIVRATDPSAFLHGIDIPFGWRIDIDPISMM